MNTVLSTLFAPPRRLHHWLDNTTPRRTGNVDRCGFTLWTVYIVPNGQWQLALSFEHYYRQGELLEVSNAIRENRYTASVTLRF